MKHTEITQIVGRYNGGQIRDTRTGGWITVDAALLPDPCRRHRGVPAPLCRYTITVEAEIIQDPDAAETAEAATP